MLYSEAGAVVLDFEERWVWDVLLVLCVVRDRRSSLLELEELLSGAESWSTST
jgi:hypothetical protein